MDPFRDELAAAHEKIAQLEKDLQELKTAVDPYVRSRRQRDITFVIILCMVALGVGFVAGGASERGDERAHRMSASHPGVAIAPTSRSTAPLAAASFGPPSPALDKQNPYVINKCNCQPGDPLCSCL